MSQSFQHLLHQEVIGKRGQSGVGIIRSLADIANSLIRTTFNLAATTLQRCCCRHSTKRASASSLMRIGRTYKISCSACLLQQSPRQARPHVPILGSMPMLWQLTLSCEQCFCRVRRKLASRRFAAVAVTSMSVAASSWLVKEQLPLVFNAMSKVGNGRGRPSAWPSIATKAEQIVGIHRSFATTSACRPR